MGGDHGPSVTLPACRAFLDAHPQADLLLVGTADALAPAPRQWPRCTRVVHGHRGGGWTIAVEVALRRKRDSSMRVAIAAAEGRQGQAAATPVCPAGNTGALMAVARYVLKTTEGIDRPAIAACCPTAAAASRPCSTSAPTSTAGRAPAAVRRDGQRTGQPPRRQ
jgi:glycerol-3-phosphate acyltransferase PlsX